MYYTYVLPQSNHFFMSLPMESSTRERILLAAVTVFAEKGFKGATVREICSKAGAANLNSVIYYFNGKENLYKAVLAFMFEDADKFLPPESEQEAARAAPEKRLALFIRTYCRIIYVVNSRLDADLSAIFARELTHPSPFLAEMVARYIRPSSEELRSILREILGGSPPAPVVRDCEACIMGQIYHHLLARPLIEGTDPDHPDISSRIDSFAEHVSRFTLGGLESVKNNL